MQLRLEPEGLMRIALFHLNQHGVCRYVVQAGIRSVSRSRGLSILVQSAVKSPPELEAEIECWLAEFRSNTLEAIGDGAFSEFKEAVALAYERPHKTLSQASRIALVLLPLLLQSPPPPHSQECASMWSEIVEGTHAWHRDSLVAAEARKVDLSGLLTLFDAHFVLGAPDRRAVISFAFSQTHANELSDVVGLEGT